MLLAGLAALALQALDIAPGTGKPRVGIPMNYDPPSAQILEADTTYRCPEQTVRVSYSERGEKLVIRALAADGRPVSTALLERVNGLVSGFSGVWSIRAVCHEWRSDVIITGRVGRLGQAAATPVTVPFPLRRPR